jgi:hypothetical protein
VINQNKELAPLASDRDPGCLQLAADLAVLSRDDTSTRQLVADSVALGRRAGTREIQQLLVGGDLLYFIGSAEEVRTRILAQPG